MAPISRFGSGGPDLRFEKYTGPLKAGDWVERGPSDFVTHDEFFAVPAGIEQMQGCQARLINLRGDVRLINVRSLVPPPRDSLATSLANFSLVSLPSPGDEVQLAEFFHPGPEMAGFFQAGPTRMLKVEERGELRLARVENRSGETRELGVSGLKRSDLGKQIDALLKRQNPELCSAGLGATGNALIVGGVRLACRR